MLDSFTNAYMEHVEDAQLAGAHGATLSKTWQGLIESYDAYQYRQASPIHELIAAVAAGEPEARLNELHLLTVAHAVGSTASASGTAEMIIQNGVRDAIAGKLREEYSKTATESLVAVGNTLSLNWVQFVALAEATDVEADPATLIGKPSDVQMAWLKAAEVSTELDMGFLALAAAARLAGVRLPSNDHLYGLILPTTGVGKDRRAAWAAYDAAGRTGRWGAVHKAGFTPTPIQSTREYVVYARPTSVAKSEHVGSGVRQVIVDAEDGTPIE